MRESWRFIDTSELDPATNMAIDEAMLRVHSQGDLPPTLRFYTWRPAALSIGYFQEAEKEIDLDAVKKHGLGFVRRITGGRAVLHDRELTYSLVISEKHPLLPDTVTESYRVISTALQKGFSRLGLNAYMSRPRSEEERLALRQPRSSLCFDAPSWYELVVEGRKVVGSAQTRQKGVVLQHGSILLDIDVNLLFNLLKFKNEALRERLKGNFFRQAVAINQLRSQPVTLTEVKAAFKAGFEEAFQVELVEGGLTKEEEETAARLAREKYGNDKWNLRK